MQVTVREGLIQQQAAELVVVNLFEGVTVPGGATGAVDRALGGAISERASAGDPLGKFCQMSMFYPRGAMPAARVLVVGLGKAETLTLDRLRQIAAAVARHVRAQGVVRYLSIVHGAGIAGFDPGQATQALVEGTLLGAYRFAGYGARPEEEPGELVELTLVTSDASALEAIREGAETGRIIAQATNYARDLVNQPANFMTPTDLAHAAESMARERNILCEVLGPGDMQELGMGALLGVAQGSNQEPRFIAMEYDGKPGIAPVIVVGKGITFDSGGISIKPSDGMDRMKDDMAGAAATLGVMRAVADLHLPIRVIGLVAATENLPSGKALKPGDVVKAMGGLTIEIISTDAEGRLILADALGYAARCEPAAVVDLATLTGGCVVALGTVAAGLMGSDQALVDALRDASQDTGELVWQLPLFERYAEQIKSDVADVKNSGGRAASAITAAKFLERFSEGYPWAHLDIAGLAWTNETEGYVPRGATGYGVRLLVEWLQKRALGA
ncbi:MAG: leucyl aminopeptidase [Anaerolineae bacterium]|jgi:leucyl aminopeptidase|nr:leucyl aminopeptidase [Chloroflexota bacterium]